MCATGESRLEMLWRRGSARSENLQRALQKKAMLRIPIPTGDVKRESDRGRLHIHARGRSLSRFSIPLWENGVCQPRRSDSDSEWPLNNHTRVRRRRQCHPKNGERAILCQLHGCARKRPRDIPSAVGTLTITYDPRTTCGTEGDVKR